MAIDYSVLPLAKPRPRAADRLQRTRDKATAERKCYAIVNRRDGNRCVFPGCRSPRHHHHHILLRSHGGGNDPNQICSLCKLHHAWVHGGLVRVEGTPPDLVWSLTSYGVELGLRIPAK